MAKLPNYYKVSVDGLTVKLDPIYEGLVQVVRCKDCIYAELAEDGDLYCYGPIGIDGTVGFNDFCSCGERRGNDGNL